MTEQQGTRTLRVRLVQRDDAPTDLRTALAHRLTPTPPAVTIAEQVAREQAEK
jgi:hypothetical protein